ncbi:GNAT family N-acetyltransferase [Clostridium sp. D2Q-14]|uniref:GNAT family N-acetyltransferase n=1 Tax=Anaeromonas gelatinilytica TaxID=2683194 RepID=UPI00193B0556|nr:GNAT family N-acetyltransferase [Anaeromonas gelatinilytica]MBS4535324.1 GNAT family N-acetyltransferase [Anaeromonas gelatinilytica]
MEIDKLYKLEKKDIDKSAKILVKAFYDYPIFRYFLGKKYNEDNLRTVFKFIIRYTMIYGKAYASSSNIEGILLFLYHDNYKFNLIRILRSGGLSLLKLGGNVGNRFGQFNEFYTRIHQDAINEPHQYIMLIGVDPSEQGQGHGGKLLKSIVDLTEKSDESCYLETHKFENVAIYKKYGFKVVFEGIIPETGITQWSMLKE